jgi:hypothetical protein
MPQPAFTQDCVTGFNEMNTLESPNDFIVCGLEDNLEVSLVEKGFGGMARVKEILAEHFQGRTAVAIFRITAVDDVGFFLFFVDIFPCVIFLQMHLQITCGDVG